MNDWPQRRLHPVQPEGEGWSKEEYHAMLQAAIATGSKACDQATHYGLTVLLLRRALISALVVLDKGHVATAKRLLRECLAKVDADARKRAEQVRAIREQVADRMREQDEGA